MFPKILLKTLSFKDKSSWFMLDLNGEHEHLMQFSSLYEAAKVTGISICALRNACEKTNKTITRRRNGPIKYEIWWAGSCLKCVP